MSEQLLLPLSDFLGAKFSLDNTSRDYAMEDDEAAFMLEVLGGMEWSEPICRFDQYVIRQHGGWTEGGNVGLFLGDDLIGFYEGLNLWIRPEHRGKGLAVPLILSAARLRGGTVLPEGVKSQHYSPSGLLAHSTAHLHALLCAIKHNEAIPEAVLREYNLHDPADLLRMFGIEDMKDLSCCQPEQGDRDSAAET
jgi:GNAT superfamily N-acetyltransferase